MYHPRKRKRFWGRSPSLDAVDALKSRFLDFSASTVDGVCVLGFHPPFCESDLEHSIHSILPKKNGYKTIITICLAWGRFEFDLTGTSFCIDFSSKLYRMDQTKISVLKVRFYFFSLSFFSESERGAQFI